MKYYLAIDIGASSGRHILCHLDEGRLVAEEIHRFENGPKQNEKGVLCWDVERLFEEIVSGMKKCKKAGKIPVSMGIDTWGVDFVLADRFGEIIGDSVSYRDKRTDNVMIPISESVLYRSTGIQKQKFNTIYQLAYLKEQFPEQIESASHMLMLPDYFNYLLTGNVMQEYTNATTTGLVNAEKCDWNYEIIGELGLPEKIFTKISRPGTLAGCLKKAIADNVGYDTKVILTASHDTASAVMAVPSNREDIIYLSSGTWSLMGVERKCPDCSEISEKYNYTNEGGYDYRFRYLKNIMGLWMIQQLRHELDDKYSFSELCCMAEQSDIDVLIDCGDDSFLSPDSMKEAIVEYCKEHYLQVPETVGDFARVIYRSLALCYQKTVEELEKITGKTYSAIHIIGGGSNADYLNRLTAEFTGKPVYAGPSEATAYGNIAAQLLAGGEVGSLQEVRKIIRESCELRSY